MTEMFSGYENAMDLLIKNGANVNFANDRGETLLMLASENGIFALGHDYG